MTITTEELKRLVDDYDNHGRRSELNAMAPSLARSVIAAEKLVEEAEKCRNTFTSTEHFRLGVAVDLYKETRK